MSPRIQEIFNKDGNGKITAMLGPDSLNSLASTYRIRASTAAGFTIQNATSQDVHHVVEQNDKRALPARLILQSVGIDIDDLENLVVLPRSNHQYMHTNLYIQSVNAALGAAAPGGARRRRVYIR